MKSAFKQILEYLEKPHAEIRYGAFLLCDHLFRTYDNFRELMVEELPLLMVHSVGTEDAVPLPPPKPAAKALRQLALLSVLDWYHLYGPVHIELKMAYNFLRECFKRAVEAARSMEAKSKMEAGKRQQLKKTLSEIKDSATEDASRTVKVSMSSSVQVLATVSMGGICCAQFDLRDNGLLNRTHTVSFLHPAPTGIPTTEDNEQVIENARDAYRLIKKRYLPQVKMWQKVLDSNKDATCDKREVVSELLNALLKLVQQCKQLKLVENNVNSGDVKE
ncbi:hypothetical protein B566_EDAN007041 [Ephemera danica]|nr:hypothetical protein B566_EDAN007041 [Ephemera danica]